MFDAISQSVKAQPDQIRLPKAEVSPRAGAAETQKAPEPEKKAEKSQQISPEMLENLKTDFEMIHNVGFQFSVHEQTNRTIVRVINEETQELIREIPSEEMLNIMAKMDEMMGSIFDRQV